MGTEQSLKTGRGKIQLFLKSNFVTGTDNRITIIFACLREGIVGIYAQRNFNELNKETNTPSWKEFVRELKIILSNKSNAADTKWKIEKSRQCKKYIVNFIIKFEVLAMKAEIDNLYAIFLLKKNVQADIIKMILGYPLIAVLETLKE